MISRCLFRSLLVNFTWAAVFLCVCFACTTYTFSAPDHELSYHGKLTDNLGLAVPDGNYDFTLTIYDAASGGTCLWTARGACGSPTPKILTVTNGVFSTILGESGDNALNVAFDANYYLEIKIGTNTPMSPRRKMTPTGFALNAHRLNGLTADNYIDTSATAQTKQGNFTIGGNLTVDGIIYDSNGHAGTIGQILSTTATGTDWITQTDSDVLAALSCGNNQVPQWNGSSWICATVSSGGMAIGDAITSSTPGSILFANATGALAQDNANFFWDNTNKRLGIGTNTPSANLTVKGTTTEASLGAEQVTNGNFDTDATGWTATTWTWGSNRMNHTGSAGAIASIMKNNGGTGYTNGDVLTLTNGANNATITVTSVLSGKITSFNLTSAGTACTVNANVSTTGGTGTGANFSIVRLVDSANTLSQNVSATVNYRYRVTYTVTRSAGEIFVALDSIGHRVAENGTYTHVLTSNSGNLIFTPTVDFTGSIDVVSVRRVLPATAVASALNSDGSVGMELRAGGSGLWNTFIGVDAGESNLGGNANTALGNSALRSNTTGSSNVAIGFYSLYSNTTGFSNTAIGTHALRGNTTGVQNTATGINALAYNTTGVQNTATGFGALFLNTSGSENTAFGYGALGNNTTGYNNIGVGSLALSGNISGYENIAIGRWTLYSNTTGNNNIALGSRALHSNITGLNNVATGPYALYSNTTGGNNIASGDGALFYNTTGSQNIAFGGYSLYANVAGNSNTASGYQSLSYGTNGSYNTASGIQSMQNNVSSSSVGIGREALRYNIGDIATGVGYDVMSYNIGTYAVGMGYQALRFNQGTNNIALGSSAFNTFNQNAAGAKSFAPTDIDISANTITITAHGFGSANSYVNLYFTTTGNTPVNLSNNAVNQFRIIDANTIECVNGAQKRYIQSQGTGTHTLTPQYVYTNTTAIGYNAEPTASNQIMMGDANVTQLVPGSNGLANLGSSTNRWNTVYANNLSLANPSGSYINFGNVDGTTGYGFRDNAGVLEYKNSSGSWTAFSASGGMAIGSSITSATVGSILFAGTGGTLSQDNTNLYWDDANDRLGLGTKTLSNRLTVEGSVNIIGGISDPDSQVALTLNSTAGNLNGTYAYRVTFVDQDGNETSYYIASPTLTVTNQQINVSNIPVSPDSRVVTRRLYRNAASVSPYYGPWKLVTVINDNVTTTYTDNIADASLGVSAPPYNKTGQLLKFAGTPVIAMRASALLIGKYAGASSANLPNATFVGYAAGENFQGANSATAIGSHAARNNNASDIVAVGALAMQNNTGVNSVGIGVNALQNNSGGFSTGVGYNAASSNIGSLAVGIGYGALSSNQGAQAVGIGGSALANNTGQFSNGVGYYSLGFNTGSDAIGFGAFSGWYNTGSNAIGVGSSSMRYNTGNYSIGIGNNSLYSNSGLASVGIGALSLRYNTGGYNTAIGHDSFNNFTDATALAKNFLPANVTLYTGSPASSIVVTSHGFGATGTYVTLYLTTTGTMPGGLSSYGVYKILDANTVQSVESSITSSGTGTHTFTPAVSYTNSTAIGYNAEPTASNQIMMGDANVTQLVPGSNGVANLGSSINRWNTVYAANGTINTSDITLKTNIAYLNYGLDAILKINPILFNWKDDEIGNNKKIGFSAQELQGIIPEVVRDNGGTLGVYYSDLIPVTVNAIKEQQKLIQTNTNDLSMKASAATVGQLQNMTEERFDKVASILRSTTYDDKTIRDDVFVLQSDINDLSDDIDAIQKRIAQTEEMHTMLTDFFQKIDGDRLIFVDKKGNLTIDGVIVVDSIETENLAITGEEKGATIGTAAIAQDAYDVFVPTTAVVQESRIFVTPKKDVVTQTISVTRIDDHSGFHVTVPHPVDKPLEFDWLIVEDRIKKEDDADPVVRDAEKDEGNEVVLQEMGNGQDL